MRLPDPYAGFRFVVEIDGLRAAGFSEITGLQTETELEDVREGGINDYVYKLAKLTKSQNLILKRGLTADDELWQWHQDVVRGEIVRRNVAVVLRDEAGEETWRWVFLEAYPVKWSGTDLNATNGTTVVESVELVHLGMTG